MTTFKNDSFCTPQKRSIARRVETTEHARRRRFEYNWARPDKVGGGGIFPPFLFGPKKPCDRARL